MIDIKKILALTCIATTATAQLKETPLLKIDNETIALEEFEAIYEKNKAITEVEISKQEYFDLFLRYKLKVHEAKHLGLDTTQSYRDECTFYFDELAKQYLVDTAAIANKRQELIDRMKEEIDASHILVRPATSSPEDTLLAYQKIAQARKRVLNGEDLETVAREISDDPSAKRNGGHIGYFTAFQMVEPFEDIAYATPVGEVSDIFKSRFGYHFLRVNARRNSEGEVLVAHIMKMVARDANPDAWDRAKAQIDSLAGLLAGGHDFAQLAREASDDKQSAINGGQMPWFSRGQIVAQFADAAFQLNENGQISEPIATPFGWHIIKRIDRRTQKSAAEIDKIIANAARNGHSIGSIGEKSMLEKLKKTYNFQWNTSGRTKLIDAMKNNAGDADKQAKLAAITEGIATYDGGKIHVTAEFLKETPWNYLLTDDENLENIAKKALFDYEKTQLPSKSAEFKYTMQEYYDGLLIFEINQRKIWNDTSIDSIAIDTQHAQNPSRYARGGKFDGIIYMYDRELTDQEIDKIATGDAKLQKKAKKALNISEEQNGIYSDIIWPNIKSRYAVAVGKLTDGETVPVDQAAGQIISDIQQQKDRAWTDELKTKHNVEILKKIK